MAGTFGSGTFGGGDYGPNFGGGDTSDTLTVAVVTVTAVALSEGEALTVAAVSAVGVAPAEGEPLVPASVTAEAVAPSEPGAPTSEALTVAVVVVEAVAPSESTAPDVEVPPVASGPTGGAWRVSRDYGDESDIYPSEYPTRETLAAAVVTVEATAPKERTEFPRPRLMLPRLTRRRASSERLRPATIEFDGGPLVSSEALPCALVAAAASGLGEMDGVPVAELERLRAAAAELDRRRARGVAARRAREEDDEQALLALAGLV